MRNVIHEMKNHLAIAVANVEAFRDGVLDASPARLGAVLQALAEVDVLLGQLRHETATATLATSMHAMDVCAVITNEVLGPKHRPVSVASRSTSTSANGPAKPAVRSPATRSG